MRLLTLLFSLYIACLSCLPCMDEAVVCVEQAGQTTVAAHTDYSRANVGDWCSPLCQCHCCAGAVAPAVSVTLVVDLPPLTWDQTLRRRLVVAEVPVQPSQGVWQPPRA